MTDRSRGEVRLIAETGFILLVTAMAYGFSRLVRSGSFKTEHVLPMLALPLSAMLLFALVATVSPSLLAPGRLAFPLNFTLPIVFAALLYVSQVIWLRGASALVVLPEELQAVQIWTQPGTMVVVAIGQALALTGAMLLVRRDRPRTSER